MTEKVKFKLFDGERHRFNGTPKDHVGPCYFFIGRGSGEYLQSLGKGKIVGDDEPTVVEPAKTETETDFPKPKKRRGRKNTNTNFPPLTP